MWPRGPTRPPAPRGGLLVETYEWEDYLRGTYLEFLSRPEGTRAGGNLLLCGSGDFLQDIQAHRQSRDRGPPTRDGVWVVVPHSRGVALELRFRDGRNERHPLAHQRGNILVGQSAVRVSDAGPRCVPS